MCGVAGYINLDGEPAASTIVTSMMKAIRHRGPDGEGSYIDGQVGLGHVRLSIIDLTDGGRQPMQSPSGRYIIIYNGELYNFLELRVELQSKGVSFTSRSDTEVILRAYEVWGDDAFERFNGMFALAIWDKEKRILTLARDRMGVKPLYVAYNGVTFAFGSEVKAIFGTPWFKPRLDLAGLREYLTFQNFYGERTLFHGISLMSPGTITKVSASGAAISQRTFSVIQFNSVETLSSEAEVAEELSHRFAQAVSRQLIADVDVGAYLSGGMDSGSIVSVAASKVDNLRTFTCGFDTSSSVGMEQYFDERKDAELMSAVFETEHYEMVLKAGDMEKVLPGLVHHLEEPRVGQSYPNYYIARLASKFNKVVLSGAGGDELFGGYPWRCLPCLDRDPEVFQENVYNQWQRILPDSDAALNFAPIWNEVKDAHPRDTFNDAFTKPISDGVTGQVDAVLTFETKTFLHGLLVVSDKIAMAHGLEERVPFLDNDLVDFALALPAKYKIGGYPWAKTQTEADGERSTEGKKILRTALSSRIPSVIANRDKQGFSAPDAGWFRGRSAEFVSARIGNPHARIYRVLNYAAISPLLDDHSQGQNRRLLIWSLLYLEQIFQEYDLV
jgi:asparagine synthase (glutamine-hydrolysing)